MLASCDEVIAQLPSSRQSRSMSVVSERGVGSQPARPAHQPAQPKPSASARPSSPRFKTTQPVGITTEAEPKGRDEPSVSGARHEPMVSPNRVGRQRRERHAIRKPRPSHQAAAVQSSPPRRLLRESTRQPSKAKHFQAKSLENSFQKAKTASERHWLGTFQSARPGRTRSADHDRSGRTQQIWTNLSRVIGLGMSQQSARAEPRPPTASRSPCLGSRSAPFGINPSVGTTTERGAAGHLLSNKTTHPIHHDMNRAPTTTFAGRPYNAWCFSCEGQDQRWVLG
jgi:hypothetical protein